MKIVFIEIIAQLLGVNNLYLKIIPRKNLYFTDWTLKENKEKKTFYFLIKNTFTFDSSLELIKNSYLDNKHVA